MTSSQQDIDITLRRLSSRLRVEMNGAVSATMRESGVNYGLNYGVSIPTIQDIVEEYRGNHALALRLFESRVRELKLAAIFIEAPEDVTPEQLELWAAGITTREIAEQMSYYLISKVDGGFATSLSWLKSSNDYVCYAALMSLHNVVKEQADKRSACVEAVMSELDTIIAKASSAGMLWHGVLTLLLAVAGTDSELSEQISQRLAPLAGGDDRWLSNLSREFDSFTSVDY